MLEFTRIQKLQLSGFKSMDVEAFTLSYIANHHAVGFWLDRISQRGFTDRRYFTAIDALVAACIFRNQSHDIEIKVESTEGHLVEICGAEAGAELFKIAVDVVTSQVTVLLSDITAKPDTTTQYNLSIINGRLCITDGVRECNGTTKLYYHRDVTMGRLVALSENRIYAETDRLSATAVINTSYLDVDKPNLDAGEVIAYGIQYYAGGEVDMAFRYWLPVFGDCKDAYSIKRNDGKFGLYVQSNGDTPPLAEVLESGEYMTLKLGMGTLKVKTI